MGKVKIFNYRDNTGGSNLRSNEINLNQGEQRTEMTYIENMEIYREGGFQAQKGNAQLNTGVSDATAILGIGEYRTATNVYALYVKASGKCYSMDSDGGAETEIKSGLNTSAVPVFVNYGGLVGVFNGQNTPFFFDGATTPAPNVTTPPSDWSSLKPHTASNLRSGRILAAAGSNIYWNALGDHNDWTTSSDAGQATDVYQDVSPVTAIANYGNAVSIHTASNRIYILTGSSFDDYVVVPMASNRSATGKLAVATVQDFQFFFSGDSILPIITTDLGVIRLGKDTEISYKIHPFLSGTVDDLPILPIDRATLADVILLSYDLKNELIAYFKTTGRSVSAAYDLAAIYNLGTRSWVFRKATPVTAAAIVGGKLLTGTADGKILQEFTETSIVGDTPFLKRVLSPFFDFGAPQYKKRILRMWLWLKADAGINATIRFRQDYKADTIVLERTIASSQSDEAGVYNLSDYGVGTYAVSETFELNFPLNLTGKNFQFELVSNESNLDFRVIAYSFEVEYLDAY